MSGGWIPGCTRTSLRILAGRGICAGIDFWTAWAYDGLASCLSSRLLIFSSSWKILLVRPVQPTCIPQEAHTSVFTITELVGIVLGAIPPLQPEPSLLYSKLQASVADIVYYIDDLFTAHKDFETQFFFLAHHLFPRIAWAKLHLVFDKMILFTDKVQVLGDIHEIGGCTTIKKVRTQKILDWPAPQSQADVRLFLGTVQTTQRWVKSFVEIARPLQHLTGNIDWR